MLLMRLSRRVPRAESKTSLNNTWHRYNRASDTVIVFVHGLLSSADSCWTTKGGEFWPALVSADSEFGGTNIFLGAYHTSISSGRYDIAQCSRELLDEIRGRQAGHKSVLEHKNIIFLCHSLGGIVCRRLIEENQAAFSGKLIGILLYASPSLGSDWANTFTTIARIYKHEVAAELVPESRLLKDIDDRFRAVLDAGQLQIVGAEAVEHWGPLKVNWLPDILRPIVTPNSASRYFGATRQIPKTDHFSIVKPSSHNSESHKFLRTFFQTKIWPRVEANTEVDATNSESISDITRTPGPERVLFDVYTSQCQEYYVERGYDKLVADACKLRSVWLFGGSGVGKTTLLRRYIDIQAIRPVEVTLSQLDVAAGQEAVFREVLEATTALRKFTGNGSALRNAVEAVCLLSAERPIPLFVDEVPIDPKGQGVAVAVAIGTILERVKRRVGDDVRFLVASIGDPLHDTANGKFREGFSVIEMYPWTREELLQLISKIESAGIGTLSPAERESLIQAANGSPRFIKTFFRNSRIHNLGECATESLIRITAAELRGL